MPARTTDWIGPALAIAAAVTALRLAAIWFSRADLYVDEAQYWLWGQNLDLGYYSKPPLIGWLLRAVTDLAGSDSAFAIRAPGPVLHAITALLLGAVAARLGDARAALWAVVVYLTLPLVAVGSALISTDTVLAPFYALALFCWLRLAGRRARARDAVIGGAALGLAFLAKYAALYFLAGAFLAALFAPRLRVRPGHVLLFLIAFGAVAAPNVWWNLTHGLTTVEHTIDNTGWLRGLGQGAGLRPDTASLAEFLLGQFIAAGPFVFASLLVLPFWRRPPGVGLIWFVLPVIAVIAVQALLSRAYANWSFTAYLPGAVLAALWLSAAHRRWLWLSLVVNGTVSLAVPAVAIWGMGLSLGGQPLMARYIGRDEVSRALLDLAAAHPGAAIVARDRDILADLFWTGRDAGVRILSVPPRDRPRNYYQQTYPLRPYSAPQAIFVTSRPTVECANGSAREIDRIATAGTAYARADLRVFLVSAACLVDLN